MEPIYIIKSTGEKETFAPSKLLDSLMRAKADKRLAEKIVDHIKVELKDGMSTKEIYRHAFEMLSHEEKPAAARYSLRRAIMELGPTGFPFEKLVSQILASKGYETETDVIVKGECTEHEIDVVAWNENKLIMIEAKFHNELGLKSDLKVVLYVKARYDDLLPMEYNFGKMRKLDEGWLVTNTKFSSQAISYALCKQGIKLIGWNYPDKGNLQDLIEEEGLYPITLLKSISMQEKKNLMASGVIICSQALENPDIVEQAGVHKEKMKMMMQEIREIQN